MFAGTFKPAMRTGLVLAAALAQSACATLSVGNDYDHKADFAAYHTFAWLSLGHRAERVRNPLVPRRVREAIENGLTQKGYRLVDAKDTPDFFVDYTIGSRERIDVESYPVGFRGPYYWGYPYWGERLSVRQYRDGTLSIDVFDGHSHQPVWHGWAKKELTEADMNQPEEPIRSAVGAVLAQFPPH